MFTILVVLEKDGVCFIGMFSQACGLLACIRNTGKRKEEAKASNRVSDSKNEKPNRNSKSYTTEPKVLIRRQFLNENILHL